MKVTILILFAIIIYLTIGKVIVKLLEEYAIIDELPDNSSRFFAAMFFPITLMCIFIGKITEKFSDMIVSLFDKN